MILYDDRASTNRLHEHFYEYTIVDAHLEPMEVLEAQTSHGGVALQHGFNFFSAGVSEFAHLGEEEGVLTAKIVRVRVHFELRLRPGVAKHTLWVAGYTKLVKCVLPTDHGNCGPTARE